MTPRFIQLHPRTKKRLLTIRREAAADGAHRVATRIHAVLLNDDENTSGEIAKTLKVSLSGVSEWLKVYSEQGVDGLMEGRRSGRPSLSLFKLQFSIKNRDFGGLNFKDF